jgi:hypothetical protein
MLLKRRESYFVGDRFLKDLRSLYFVPTDTSRFLFLINDFEASVATNPLPILLGVISFIY